MPSSSARGNRSMGSPSRISVWGVFAVATGLGLVTLSGCGGASGPARSSISGTVKLDGAPLAEGTISFIPTGPKGGPSSGAPIANGKYTIAAAGGPTAGDQKVEIHSLKKTGKQIPVAPPAVSATGTVDETVEAIPAKYNSATTLTQTVKAGHNTFDFDLKSQ